MLAHLPNNPIGIKVLKSSESDILKRLYPAHEQLPPSPAQCITCHGSKTFDWWDTEFREVVPYQCTCGDQWVLHRYFLYNGIGLNFQRIGWQNCFVSEDAKKQVALYLDLNNLPFNLEIGAGLFIYGPPGTGKTLLSTLLLRRTLAFGHSGHFTTFLEMKDAYTDAWKDGERREWYQQKIRNTSVLVIDDPGKEMGGEGTAELTRTIMDDLIRHRMSANLPTIITSNDEEKDFRLRYGGNVDSLMSERMVPVRVEGDDWRSQHLQSMIDDKAAGRTRPIVVT